jgi:hypothetical protein
MPNPNAVVATIKSIEPTLDHAPADGLREGVWVEFRDGRRAWLEPGGERALALARVLDGLKERRLPVYLELDPGTSAIERVLIPHVSRVVAVQRVGETLEVRLELSHARHTLPSDSPDFEVFHNRLRKALDGRLPVVVTVDDAQQIIDVSEYTPDPEDPRPPLPDPHLPLRVPPRPDIRDILRRFWRWYWWPWWWCFWPWRRDHCVSLGEAQNAFNAMAAKSCNPVTVPPPCIPFLYPDDGCWGRAHEMCRLMINMGLKPAKVWISGSLQVATRNNPNCVVHWGWHVAPTLCVCRRWGLTQDMVIDPSLFKAPVTEGTWKSVQGDPGAQLTDTAWTDFLWGQTDPNFTQTNSVLANYRSALQARSAQNGPPPYANCP